MKYTILSCTDQGNVRENNEDAVSYGIDAKRGICWMALADGMGGHKAGEVASQLFIEQIEQAFCQAQQPTDWCEYCCDLLSEANHHIFRHAESNADCTGMGTTGILVVCEGRKGYLAWVGDSRCYLWRDNKLQQLSRDHSMLHYLVDKGAITEEAAEEAPGNHLLARAVGVKEQVEVDGLTFELFVGDRLLISSDGLHDAVSNEQLEALIAMPAPQLWQKQRWLQAALSAGSRDNISFILLSAEAD